MILAPLLLLLAAAAPPEPAGIRYLQESRFRNRGEAEHVTRLTFEVQPLPSEPGRLHARVTLLAAESPSVVAPPPWRGIPLVVSFTEDTQEAKLENWAEVRPLFSAAARHADERLKPFTDAALSNPAMVAGIGVRLVASTWAMSAPTPVADGPRPLAARADDDWRQERTWIVRNTDANACTAEVERVTTTRWTSAPQRVSGVRTTAIISTIDGWPITLNEVEESPQVLASGGEPGRTTVRRLTPPPPCR